MVHHQAPLHGQVNGDKVILGLSGGVDSSVAAALLHKAIGDQLTCIFVNNGVLRGREPQMVREVFGRHFRLILVADGLEEEAIVWFVQTEGWTGIAALDEGVAGIEASSHVSSGTAFLKRRATERIYSRHHATAGADRVGDVAM